MSSVKDVRQPGTRSDAAGEAKTLRVLFDVYHPAQVHLFKNVIRELEDLGHEPFVASRSKEVTTDLLDEYDIPHAPLTASGGSLPALVGEQLLREVRLLSIARQFRPDVIVGRLSPSAAHVSRLVGCTNVVVSDTRVDSTLLWTLHRVSTFPFVDTVCAPPQFDLPVDSTSRRALDFQELAYLHPEFFEPRPSVLQEYGVDPDEPYFVVRLAGWDAHHDVGYSGLSLAATRELVSFLEQHGTVYVSAEGTTPDGLEGYEVPIPPDAIHQLLYFADVYVGDSGTMASESAMLGTPAVRANTMVGEGDENVFVELEERYGLLRSFEDERDALEEVKRRVSNGIDHDRWRAARQRLVEDHRPVTETVVSAILEAGNSDAE